jgi:hypothetical protein
MQPSSAAAQIAHLTPIPTPVICLSSSGSELMGMARAPSLLDQRAVSVPLSRGIRRIPQRQRIGLYRHDQ